MSIRSRSILALMAFIPLFTVAQELPLLAKQRCNDDPELKPGIIAGTYGGNLANFIEELNRVPTLLAAIGNPAIDASHLNSDELGFSFTPLADRDPIIAQMSRTLPLEAHSIFVFPNKRACEAAPPVDVVKPVIEFFNADLDHFFYTSEADEIAAIDAGRVGPGWTRTGKSFDAVKQPGCPFAWGQTVVYRFHGIPHVGPNSHFFTRDRVECSLVNKSEQWNYEGVAFWASEPFLNGSCESLPPLGRTRVPLYRAWRPIGDSNHRFTTDRAVIDEMVIKGWVNEGPVMCVLGSN